MHEHKDEPINYHYKFFRARFLVKGGGLFFCVSHNI